MNIKKRITLTIVLFCSILIIVMAYIMFFDSSYFLNNQKKEFMNIQLNRVSENINYLIKLNEKETEKLATNRMVEKYLKGEITESKSNEYLSELMKSQNNDDLYKDFFVLNKDGMIITTTMESARNLDLSNRDYFLRARRNLETVNSNILVARSDKELIIITLTPIIIDDEINGFAGIAIKANYFSNFLSDMKLSDSGYYIILDQNGLIVSHPNENYIAKNFNTLNIDKEENIIIDKKMEKTSYKLMAIASKKEINKEQNSLLYNGFLIGFFGIFASIILALILSNRINKPIDEINKYIEKVMKRSFLFKERINQQKELFKKENEMNKLKRNTQIVLNEIENNNLANYTKNIEMIYENTLRFISKLSHDLRTPLTLIKGYTKALEIDQTKDQKYIKKINKSLTDIENIIFNELDIAYELNKNNHLDLCIVDLNIFINELSEEIKELSKQSGRKIIITKNNILGESKIDTTNLKRAVINILNNALKYSDEKVNVNFCDIGKEILIEIEDQGIGIAEDEIKNIREMFYQTATEKEGYGLGLHIADNIISKHGFKLDISSKKNVGTVVRIFVNKV